MDHHQIRSAALELRTQTDLALDGIMARAGLDFEDMGLRRQIVDRAFRYFGPEEE